MGGFAGLTDKRFGRSFCFLQLFRLFLAGGFETLELLVRLKGAWSIRVVPGWIFEAIGVAEGGVRSGQNLPCFSLGSIGAGALPRGGWGRELRRSAAVCLFVPTTLAIHGDENGGGSTFFYRTKPISSKSFSFILSSPFRACPIGTCQGISGRSQFARQSAENQQWLAKAPAPMGAGGTACVL